MAWVIPSCCLKRCPLGARIVVVLRGGVVCAILKSLNTSIISRCLCLGCRAWLATLGTINLCRAKIVLPCHIVHPQPQLK